MTALKLHIYLSEGFVVRHPILARPLSLLASLPKSVPPSQLYRGPVRTWKHPTYMIAAPVRGRRTV
jgi:hypothetical protein